MLGVRVRRCLRNKAPQYLADYCVAVSDIAGRQRLRSAHQLNVPRYQRSTLGRLAFSVTRPTVWNSLPDEFRDPICADEAFRQPIKIFMLRQY